jgi:cellulose synthase/poly-beta-1,6-N-acetylglucosamine synthase-like glycosyltransferase
MISIITPIYNTPRHCLKRYFNALSSIDKNLFEVVLINDGGQEPDINFNDWDIDI